MAINYEYNGKSNTKKWTRADWGTYNALIWATMAVHIGRLTEHTAEAFCRRANALRLFKDAKTGAAKTITPKQIEKFFGLSTNAGTLTGAQWATRCMSETRTEGAAWKAGIK